MSHRLYKRRHATALSSLTRPLPHTALLISGAEKPTGFVAITTPTITENAAQPASTVPTFWLIEHCGDPLPTRSNTMQFKKLREACTRSGERVQADAFPPGDTTPCYCDDCHSRLVLCVTHTEGRYFEHDLEQADSEAAQGCCHRLTRSEPPASPNVKSAFALTLGRPTPTDYFCVLCDKAYVGLKTCPDCKGYIYTTEVSLRDCSGGTAAMNTAVPLNKK
ncbi:MULTISPECIES: putative zinc ribbon protein [unclassified Serratia (in: enterobacteria)]|uniref:putative zinc ribbon protein n=1 Tax=unclassified Serratia (in: enterobacteria) TaxID=2647522 RepID=UPI003075F71E